MKIVKSFPSILFLLILAWSSGLYAAEAMHFELNDGSVMVGQMVSYKDGVYTIKSPALGLVQIQDTNIRSIRKASASSTAASETQPERQQIDANQIQNLQNRMTGDQDIMNIIFSLQNDPEFQAVLQDPKLMQAIQSGDLEAIRSNQKFMELMNHEKVHQVMDEMK